MNLSSLSESIYGCRCGCTPGEPKNARVEVGRVACLRVRFGMRFETLAVQLAVQLWWCKLRRK
jgi:hypothetical protein